jgi:hypothetical protein
MKMRLTVEVPLPPMEGEKPGEFYPALNHDTRRVERSLPKEAVVTHAEYVPEVEDAKAYFRKLLRLKLEAPPLRGFKSADGYSKGDEDQPFFSEAYLYNLVGKDDARTILGTLHHLMKFMGLDPLMIKREVCAEIAAEQRAEQERIERVAKYQAFKDEFVKSRGWKRDQKTFTGYTDEQNKEISKALREAGL